MDDLHNTSLPILIIEKNKRYHEYPQIGFGDEGAIYKYNNKIALKFFDFTKPEKLPKKFEKIELLGHLQDSAACFPIGLVGYEDKKKEGYYFELVHKNQDYSEFNLLLYLKDIKKKLKYIIEADEAIKRFHKMGLILGDIREDNIMINTKGKIKFVDTDNWKYKNYDFDLIPGRSKWLSRIYDKDFSELDNDRFSFAMVAMQLFLSGTVISMRPNDRYFEAMIKYLNVSNEIKEGLSIIFSDATNKPYISEVLKNIKTEEEIISKEKIYSLNRIF